MIASGQDLRAIYREYYQACVTPHLLTCVRESFADYPEIAILLTVRLTTDARFVPSELMYWMFRDLCDSATPSESHEDWRPSNQFSEIVPLLLAAIELLQLGRLIGDDILDGHKRRQNLRSLHLELDKDLAWVTSFGLTESAVNVLLSAGPSPSCSFDLGMAALDYSQRIRSASFRELRFSAASRAMLPPKPPPLLEFPQYADLMAQKHGIGTLSLQLCLALAGQYPSSGFGTLPPIRSSAERQIHQYDVAGGIDNDWSEFSGRRGHLGWDRFSRSRGKNEVDLGRPTIWNVFLQDKDALKLMAKAGFLSTHWDLAELNGKRFDPEMTEILGHYVASHLRELLSPAGDFKTVLPHTATFLERTRDRRTATAMSDLAANVEAEPTIQPVLGGSPASD